MPLKKIWEKTPMLQRRKYPFRSTQNPIAVSKVEFRNGSSDKKIKFIGHS